MMIISDKSVKISTNHHKPITRTYRLHPTIYDEVSPAMLCEWLEAQLSHTPAPLIKLAVIQQEKCVNNATCRSTLCGCASLCWRVGVLFKRRSHAFCGPVTELHPTYMYGFTNEINVTCPCGCIILSTSSASIIVLHPAFLSFLTGWWAWPGPHCGPYGKP